MEDERLRIMFSSHQELKDSIMERRISEQIIRGIIEDSIWVYSSYSGKGVFNLLNVNDCSFCHSSDSVYCDVWCGEDFENFEEELICTMLEVMEQVEME